MDSFKTDFNGRMPVFFNDVRFVDTTYRNAFVSLMKTLAADNIILYGCGLTNNGNGTFTVATGAVVINSEIYLCANHTFACTNINEAYFVITESYDSEGLKLFGDNVQRNTYLLRRVVASQNVSQPINSISVNASTFAAVYIKEGDARLTNSRKSNNTFDNAATSRSNLDVYSTTETGTQITNSINAAISALIDGSPGALDTLNELAAALGDDANFAASVATSLSNKLANTKEAIEALLIGDITLHYHTVKTKIVNIGDWNMDTTDSLNVAHGLTVSKIRGIRVSIVEDGGSFVYDFCTANQNLVDLSGTYFINATEVILLRETGGTFDNMAFSTVPFNRGFILIDYVP